MARQSSYRVFLDTNTLIYAWDPEADKDLKRDALQAIDEHMEKGATFCIPSITLAEFLVKVPVEEHESVVSMLSERFMVYAFCEREACVSAELHQNHFAELKGRYKNSWKEEGGRKVLLADIKIVATAIANGGDVILSGDPLVSRLASGRIKAQSPSPKQPVLELEFPTNQ